MRIDCTLLKSKRKGKQADAVAHIESNTDDGVILITTGIFYSFVDTWVLDFGASFHIWPD